MGYNYRFTLNQSLVKCQQTQLSTSLRKRELQIKETQLEESRHVVCLTLLSVVLVKGIV